MAYIGREPQIGNYQVCDAISVVNAQAAYTMQVSSVNVIPESVNHMIVSLNGVIQKPGSSYTISGATITFSRNLVTGETIDFIYLLGNVLDLGTPSDDTVTGAKIVDNAINSEHYTDGSIDTAHIGADQITNAKIADDQIDSEHYVDGSIDLAHLAADSVNATKIADNAISEEHLDVTAVTGHTAETSIADGDLILIHDASASALRKMTKANFVSGIGFDPDAAVVLNDSGADVDFRVESDDNTNAIFVDGGNDVVNILGTSSRNDGGLNVNVPSSVLGTDGVAQIYCRTQETDAVNNSTVDVFRFLDSQGNLMGSNYINGDLYCHFGLGANQYIVHFSVQTAGNTTGTLTQLGTRTRGTSLVTANPVITNDGGSGNIKIRVTFINNSGVVDNQKCVVTFVGHGI